MEAGPREGFPGSWCGSGTRKIGAIGVRIERGVSYHGVALNITVRLSDFDMIDACGIPGAISTSIARERGLATEPTTESVAKAGEAFAPALAVQLGAPLLGRYSGANPFVARRELEALLAACVPAPAMPGSVN